MGIHSQAGWRGAPDCELSGDESGGDGLAVLSLMSSEPSKWLAE
jgi:hypothetical protein